ncbi:hypothetical protein P618_200145 [Holospora obtusa F1]|uniref:Solute-binding protein family 5 domain-containing protein n=1 Tax=Holospora obtusa F1 TaxID=1399147 RepID=W6TF87_HOLOB|nr:ABC transporter substrate-binding protein [Holospora obtusa]ETZ07654.1 hypothetical protein P618_200145 [Holospora obtusa F1]
MKNIKKHSIYLIVIKFLILNLSAKTLQNVSRKILAVSVDASKLNVDSYLLNTKTPQTIQKLSCNNFEEGTNFDRYHVYKTLHPHKLVNIHAPKGGILTLPIISSSFTSLNPFVFIGFPPGIFCAHEPSLTVTSLMMRCWECDFHMIPYCASKIRKAKDNSWIHFCLDPKACFHDGTPVTTEDVYATFQYFCCYGSPYRKKLGKKVSRICVHDAQNITFYMTPIQDDNNSELRYEPEFPLLLAGLPILSKADISWRDGTEDPMTPLLGSGPYQFYRHTETVTIYRKVFNFWGKDLPQFQGIGNVNEIQYKRFLTKESAFSAFIRGEIDVWKESNPEQWNLYSSFSNFKNKIQVHKIVHKDPIGMRGFFLNTRIPLFQDIRIRQGLSAILDLKFSDFQRIVGKQSYRIESFFQGTSYASSLHFTPEEYQAFLSLPVPVKHISALKLRTKHEILKHFKRSGWKLKNHVLQKDNISMRFIITVKKKEEKVWAQRFSIYLKEFGIEALVKEIDETAYYRKIAKKDFDMIVAERLVSLAPGAEQLSYWTSEGEHTQKKNYSGIQDPNIDFACKQMMLFWNDQKQYALWLSVLDRLLKLGCYVLPLHYYNTKILAHWRHVGIPAFHNFSDSAPAVSYWIVPSANLGSALHR